MNCDTRAGQHVTLAARQQHGLAELCFTLQLRLSCNTICSPGAAFAVCPGAPALPPEYIAAQ